MGSTQKINEVYGLDFGEGKRGLGKKVACENFLQAPYKSSEKSQPIAHLPVTVFGSEAYDLYAQTKLPAV